MTLKKRPSQWPNLLMAFSTSFADLCLSSNPSYVCLPWVLVPAAELGRTSYEAQQSLHSTNVPEVGGPYLLCAALWHHLLQRPSAWLPPLLPLHRQSWWGECQELRGRGPQWTSRLSSPLCSSYGVSPSASDHRLSPTQWPGGQYECRHRWPSTRSGFLARDCCSQR